MINLDTLEFIAREALPADDRNGRAAIAFADAAACKGKPTVLIAHTIKGKGVSFMENNPKFHGTAPTKEEVALALQEIG